MVWDYTKCYRTVCMYCALWNDMFYQRHVIFYYYWLVLINSTLSNNKGIMRMMIDIVVDWWYIMSHRITSHHICVVQYIYPISLQYIIIHHYILYRCCRRRRHPSQHSLCILYCTVRTYCMNQQQYLWKGSDTVQQDQVHSFPHQIKSKVYCTQLKNDWPTLHTIL